MIPRVLVVLAVVASSLASSIAARAQCPDYPPPPPRDPLPPYEGTSGQVGPRFRDAGEPPPGGTTAKPPAGITQRQKSGAVTPRGASSGAPGGRRGRGRTGEFFNWETWWWNNQHRFLDFSRDDAQATGSSDFFLGDRDRRAAAPVDPVTDRLVADRIVPALLRALESRDDDTRAAAVRALGRVGEGIPIAALASRLEDSSGEVRRCAVLALGEAEASGRLADLVRLALDSGESATIRGYALVSIGLVGDEAGVEVLRRVALGDEPSVDLRVTALAALSLVPTASVRETVRNLAADEKANENLRALAAEAVGRLCGDASSTTLLLRLLEDRSAQVRRSAALALARVEPGSKTVGDALARAVREDRDLPVRAFAAVSLGEHASAAARPALLDAFEGSGPAGLRSFAAIGLGLLGDPAGLKTLRRTLEDGDARDPSLEAAVALALGLARDRAAAGTLARIVGDASRHPACRGFAALALGLVGDRSVLPVVERALTVDAPASLLDPLVKAAGLMGADSGARAIGETLADARSDARRAALVEAVGNSKNRAFVDPLVQILSSASERDRIRVFAAIALGRLGDRRRAPVLAALTNRRNYLVPTPTIDSLVTLL